MKTYLSVEIEVPKKANKKEAGKIKKEAHTKLSEMLFDFIMKNGGIYVKFSEETVYKGFPDAHIYDIYVIVANIDFEEGA